MVIVKRSMDLVNRVESDVNFSQMMPNVSCGKWFLGRLGQFSLQSDGRSSSLMTTDFWSKQILRQKVRDGVLVLK